MPGAERRMTPDPEGIRTDRECSHVTQAIRACPRVTSKAGRSRRFSPLTDWRSHARAHHTRSKDAGGKPLTTKYWFPDQAFGGGRDENRAHNLSAGRMGRSPTCNLRLARTGVRSLL